METTALHLFMAICYSLLITTCFLLWFAGEDELPYGKIGCGLLILPIIVVILMIIADSC